MVLRIVWLFYTSFGAYALSLRVPTENIGRPPPRRGRPSHGLTWGWGWVERNRGDRNVTGTPVSAGQ